MHGNGPSEVGRGVPAPSTVLDTAMNATQSEDKTSTEGNDDESIEAEFWQKVAEKVCTAESDIQGCFSVELTDGDEPENYPVADARSENVDGTEALALAFPTEKTDPTPVEDSAVGLNVGQLSLTAGVAKRERSEGLLTVWLSGPDLEQLILPSGEPTTGHIEYLGA